MSSSFNSKRVAKNTVILYVRMIFMMLISLYTSRVILATLGVEDYGVYNVVGGMVSMFGILSASLSTAISRFITFSLGKGDKEELQRIFSTAIIIEVGLAIIIGLLIEGIGVIEAVLLAEFDAFQHGRVILRIRLNARQFRDFKVFQELLDFVVEANLFDASPAVGEEHFFANAPQHFRQLFYHPLPEDDAGRSAIFKVLHINSFRPVPGSNSADGRRRGRLPGRPGR